MKKTGNQNRIGFSLIELISVLVVLGILIGIATPRYFDYRDRAVRSKVESVIGAVGTGIGAATMALEMGGETGLLVDGDGNGFPDHLGDVSRDEDVLFDAIMEPGWPQEQDGWKPSPTQSFPQSGRYYLYIYDLNGNDQHESASEPYFRYDSQTGGFTSFIPASM